MSYKIGSFNLRNFGDSAINGNRNIAKIADIIKKEGFDVVALQEVLSEGHAIDYDYKNESPKEYSPDSPESQSFKKSLLGYLGKNMWDFKWAVAEGGLSKENRHEGYAFVWNKSRLQLAKTKLKDGTERVANPYMCSISKKKLHRKPFYARFIPASSLGGFFEFRLICLHNVYGKSIDRNKEIEIVLEEIYPRLADKIYSNKNYVPYTIMMGDYNIEIFRPWKDVVHKQRKDDIPAYMLNEKKEKSEVYIPKLWETFDKNKSLKILTVQDQFTTLKKKEMDKEEKNLMRKSNRGYTHDYDHFSYCRDKIQDAEIKYKKIDAVRKYYNDDFEKYAGEISDHIPIVMSIELNPQIDFSGLGIQTLINQE